MVFNPAIVIEDITNRRNFKNNEFVCSTADCFATVFLAANMSLPSHYQFFGLMISVYQYAIKKTNRFLWTLKSCRKSRKKLSLEQLYEQHRAKFKSENPDSNVVFKEFYSVIFF